MLKLCKVLLPYSAWARNRITALKSRRLPLLQHRSLMLLNQNKAKVQHPLFHWADPFSSWVELPRKFL